MKAYLIKADSRKAGEFLKELGLVSFTLLLSDPPFHLKERSNMATKYKGKIINVGDMYVGSHEVAIEVYEKILESGVLLADSNFISFTSKGPEQCDYFRLLEKYGFKFKQKFYMINKAPMPSIRKTSLRNAVTEILLFSRGSAPFNFLSQREMKNIFEWMPPGKWRETDYPTEKPLKLFELFIRIFSNEGDWVLDPFCGSGTTAVAALKHERNVVCIDISDNAIEAQKKRLNKYGFDYEVWAFDD